MPLKTLALLLITLSVPHSLYPSNVPEGYIELFQTHGAPVFISLHTPLRNLSVSLQECLTKKSDGEIFVIQAMGNGSQVEYFYGSLFFETDPFFIATYTIQCTLLDQRLVATVIRSSLKKPLLSLNPRAAVFCPTPHMQTYFSPLNPAQPLHHSPAYQPFPAPLIIAPQFLDVPPIISLVLSWRKTALIDALQNNLAEYCLEAIDKTWKENLKNICDDFQYPFNALYLPYPTANEVRTTPRQVCDTTQGAIDEMEKKAQLKSTSEVEKRALEKEIETLKQFIEDMKKPHPVYYDGRRLSQAVLPPTQPPTTSVTPTSPMIKQPEQETHQKNSADTPPASETSDTPPTLVSLQEYPALPSTHAGATPKNPVIVSKKPTTPPMTLPHKEKVHPQQAVPSTPAATKSTQSITPPVVKSAPLTKTSPEQPKPVPLATPPAPAKKPAKPTTKQFLEECLAAVTGDTTPPVKPQEEETPKLSNFEKKATAAEEYRLKKLEKEEAKKVAAAEKVRKQEEEALLEKESYQAIKEACTGQEYLSVIRTLSLCDNTTTWYANNLIFLTTELLQKKPAGDFSQLSQLVTNLLQQKNIVVPDNQKSHFFLYLSTCCDPEMRIDYLKKAADLKNVVAEVEWLALQAKAQLDDPEFKECTRSKQCLHKRIAKFLKLHEQNDLLKPLLPTYLLSLYSIHAQCPNIKLKTPFDELYIMAKQHLSNEDYTFLCTINAELAIKNPQLTYEYEGANTSTIAVTTDLNTFLASLGVQNNLLAPTNSATVARPLASSRSPYTNSLSKIFNDLTALRTTFEEKMRTATPARKKNLATLFSREKAVIHGTLITLLQAVKNQEDTHAFLISLEQPEYKDARAEVKAFIEKYLQTADENIQQTWRPYRVLPDVDNFSSLTPLPVPGSFAIRCPFFKQELTDYLSKAPLEKEVFKAVAALTIKFLATAETDQDIKLFLDVFETEKIFYFCIVGLLTHLKRSTNPKLSEKLGILPQLELYLKKIEDAQAKHSQGPMFIYLQKISSALQLFIKEQKSLPQKDSLDSVFTFIELSSLNMKDDTPFATVFENFQKNLSVFFASHPLTHKTFALEKHFIGQLLKKAHTFEDLQLVIEKTKDHEINGPLYLDTILDFLNATPSSFTVLPEQIVLVVNQGKENLNRHVLQVSTTMQESGSSDHDYLLHCLQQLQIRLNYISYVLPADACKTVTLPSESDYADPTKNKFLNSVVEMQHSKKKSKAVKALFKQLSELSPPELPYFMYALGTKAQPLLPDIQKQVESSTTLSANTQQAVLTGFRTLSNKVF